jgi:hypothetical protein
MGEGTGVLDRRSLPFKGEGGGWGEGSYFAGEKTWSGKAVLPTVGTWITIIA